MENAPAYKASFRDLPHDEQIRLAYEHLENLRQVNPAIIMASTCLNGQTGPEALQAGYGAQGAAWGGR